jgi:hypothetical protein
MAPNPVRETATEMNRITGDVPVNIRETATEMNRILSEIVG